MASDYQDVQGENWLNRQTNRLLRQMIDKMDSQTAVPSFDRTISSGSMVIDSTIKGLPVMPDEMTRVLIGVNSADIVYTTDTDNLPSANPVNGFRLADGGIQELFKEDVAKFRATRLSSTDAILYYEVKG